MGKPRASSRVTFYFQCFLLKIFALWPTRMLRGSFWVGRPFSLDRRGTLSDVETALGAGLS